MQRPPLVRPSSAGKGSAPSKGAPSSAGKGVLKGARPPQQDRRPLAPPTTSARPGQAPSSGVASKGAGRPGGGEAKGAGRPGGGEAKGAGRPGGGGVPSRGVPDTPSRTGGAVPSRPMPAGAPSRSMPAATSAGAGVASKRPSSGGGRLRVYSNKDKDTLGVCTLLGEYIEKGINHGRKYYKKEEVIEGHEDTEVFLYYWDKRDGDDFTGWWFGDQVGGSQVWSKVNSHSETPPRAGWKIPWDGTYERDLLLVEPMDTSSATSVAEAKRLPKAPLLPRGAREAPRDAWAEERTAPSRGAREAPRDAWAADRPAEATSSRQPQNERNQRAEIAAERVGAAEAQAQEAMENINEALRGDLTQDVLEELMHAVRENQEKVKVEQTALTKDINDARTNRESPLSISGLSKLGPRLRALNTALTTESGRIQGELEGLKQHAEEASRRAAEHKRADAVEKRDAKAFQEVLPAAMDIALQAEDAVETVAIMASSLSAEDEEELGEDARQTMEEIEDAASKAQSSLADARKAITTHLSTANTFAPQTRKLARQQFGEMQDKLTQAQKKLNPFKRLKQDWEQKVAAKQAIEEVERKLCGAELEVEKAHIMSSAGIDAQMSEEEIKAAEDLLGPAQAGIAAAQQMLLDKKSKSNSEGPLAAELAKVQARAHQSKERLDEVRSFLKKQRDGLHVQDMLMQVSERIEKVNDALDRTSEAELPFLKGVEVLPNDEGTSAIKDSEFAASDCDAAISQARSLLRSKTSELRRFSKDIAKRCTDELGEMSARLEAAATQLAEFKKETTRRKMRAMLHEAVDAVSEAEKQLESLGEVCKLFSSESLDSVSIDSLQAACEKATKTEKEASSACSQARQVLATKQKEAKDASSTMPSLVTELAKLQDRLSKASGNHQKHKKALSLGDRLIKSKKILLQEEEKISAAEQEVTKVEELATPLGDERPSDQAVEKTCAAVAAAQTTLSASIRSLERQNADALSPVKAALSKLIARNKKAQDRLTAVKASMQAVKEQVQSKAWIAEAAAKAEALDQSLEKVSAAEGPFLKGIEVLPRGESGKAIAECEAAGDAAQKALSDARTYLATQTLESKKFHGGEDKGAKTKEELTKEFAKLTDRINASAQKVSQFRRDTEGRKRTAVMQEASELIDALEAEVKKITEAAAPLATEDPEQLSADVAKKVCENLARLDEAATKNIEEAGAVLKKRQSEVKGHSAHEEQLKGLRKRRDAVSEQLRKAQDVAQDHEQRFVAKKLLSDGQERLKEMESQLEKTALSAAMLLDDGGARFLAASHVLNFVHALKAKMQEKQKTLDDLFKDIAGEEATVSKATFLSYLEKLPEELGQDLTFSAEQREAIFLHAVGSKDEKDSIGLTEFKDMFRERYMCVHSIAVTDTFEISSSKTVTKLQLNAIVEVLSTPQAAKAGGLPRVECKLLDGGESGWVTMKGNQGTVYLEPFSPYLSWTKAIDDNLDKLDKDTTKANTFIRSKINVLANGTGPLATTRTELSKLKPRVAEAQKKLDELKRKVVQAQKEYTKKEEAEKRSQQDTRDKKAAGILLKAIVEKVEAMDLSSQKLADAHLRMGSDLEAVAAPLSIVQDAEKFAAEVVKDVAAVKASIAEQQPNIVKAARGPMHEAKQEMAKIMVRAETAEKKSSSTVEAIRKQCTKLGAAKLAKLKVALREEVRRRDTTCDVLFKDIAGAEKDRISEEAFCKYVEGLAGIELSSEHAKLVCSQIEEGGIGRRCFQRLLQLFNICVKPIAITTEFAISSSKTVRMLEAEEVVEVLEGPKSDEKVGITRIRGKMLRDGACGWISVKGNQGTPFLKETAAPCFFCAAEVPLERDFRNVSAADGIVRALRPDEVLEVIEGPRKDKFDEAIRAKAKASKDGAVGWFTLKSKEGIINAEKGGNYYLCTSAIAMTDARDIKNCKVIRKLAVGETALLLEGPCEEAATGVSRIRTRSMKDGQEGWVTIRGNAGTVYAEESSKLYTLLKDTALHKKFKSEGAETVRLLTAGEAVEVTDGPKEEKFDEVVRIKGRAMSDGATGWVTLKGETLKPWTPFYKCTNGTVIHSALGGKTAQAVRRIEPGETVELLDGPIEDVEMGVMRLKGRAQKDGATGWITIKGNQGTVFLTAKPK